MRYRIYGDRVKLFDAYLIPKSKYSREWAAHVRAYNLGIKPVKTADCDLNYEPKWYENLAYWVVGNIALLVIK